VKLGWLGAARLQTAAQAAHPELNVESRMVQTKGMVIVSIILPRIGRRAYLTQMWDCNLFAEAVDWNRSARNARGLFFSQSASRASVYGRAWAQLHKLAMAKRSRFDHRFSPSLHRPSTCWIAVWEISSGPGGRPSPGRFTRNRGRAAKGAGKRSESNWLRRAGTPALRRPP